MELQKAKQMAENLIQKHKVYYNFKYNNRLTTSFGNCNYDTRTILLNPKLVKINSEQDVRDTILHEIAHALNPRQGHNKNWKRTAVEIGCKPERCYKTSEVKMPEKYTYTYVCPNCGNTITRYRKTYILACKRCCVKYNKGKYSKDYIFKLKK
jgi:predicted SprT family Zn-dependent metalloprotease